MSTNIHWTDETINPTVGCSKISSACDNCYAEVMANRLQAMGTKGYENVIKNNKWSGKINFIPSALEKPYKWKKPKKIFVGSMTDLFHKDVKIEWLFKIFKMVKENPQHTFILLTKRAANMQKMMNNYYFHAKCEVIENLWLGVTVENQKQADERVPYLLDTPASKRFVSVEPMLGEINLDMLVVSNISDRFRIIVSSLMGTKTLWDTKNLMSEDKINKLDWVIVGGESGNKARPISPRWVLSLQKQCDFAEVSFFFKQWGEFIDESQITNNFQYAKDEIDFNDGKEELSLYRCGKKIAGSLLDGKICQTFPKREENVEKPIISLI